MTTTMDVYQLCPCGSGKKLKFCCAPIAADMEKAMRQIDGKQYRLAMQTLDTAEKKSPHNAWILTTKARIHVTEQKPAEAKPILEDLLQRQPDNGLASLLYANCCLVVDGYMASLPAIQRALRRASHDPQLASLLTLQISEIQSESGKYLSARQYLTLGLRWVPEELRQQLFYRLMEMEADRSVPYPYRSVHQLLPWTTGGEANADFGKAMKLATSGCWDIAARLFGQLADQNPNVAVLSYNSAICKAWVGDEKAASELFHEAARRESDRETAIEWETIAQLLGMPHEPNRIPLLARSYSTESVARLLTRLSESSQLARDMDDRADEEENEDQDADGRPQVTTFDVLDRSKPTAEGLSDFALPSLPKMLGGVRIFDAVPEKNLTAVVRVEAIEPNFAACDSILANAAGDAIQPLDAEPQQTSIALPSQMASLETYCWLPTDGIPLARRKRIAIERWNWILEDVWSTTPQHALRGKSPREAMGDSTLSVPLAAAIYVLDVVTQQRAHQIDVPALLTRFQLPAPEPIRPVPGTEIQNFSSMQLHRLVVRELTDDQLAATLNRAILLAHQRFLSEALQEAVSRSSLHDRIDMLKAHRTLAEISRAANRRTDALEYAQRALDVAKEQSAAFDTLLQMELLQFAILAEEPDDPRVPEMLQRLYSYYGKKVSRILPVLDVLCETFGIEVTEEIRQGGTLVGATSAGGLWTPAAASESGAGKKLWLPGQS